MNLNKPLAKKHFFRLIIRVYQYEEDQDKDAVWELVLHDTKELTKESAMSFFGGTIEAGETIRKAVADDLRDHFGVKQFKIVNVQQDGFGFDRRRRRVPRLAIEVVTTFEQIDTTKKVIGRHVSWAKLKDLFPHDPVKQISEELPKQSQPVNGDIKLDLESIKAMANQFIQDAKEMFSRSIGYDAKSVRVLDELIDQYWGGRRPSNVEVLVAPIGSFLGEVIVKTLHGQWSLSNDRWAVCAGVFEIYPFSWVRKRILNGREDLLEYKYNMSKKAIAGDLDGKQG